MCTDSHRNPKQQHKAAIPSHSPPPPPPRARRYNATKLAGMHNAVVATVSYRLGGLGFAAFEGEDGAARAIMSNLF